MSLVAKVLKEVLIRRSSKEQTDFRQGRSTIGTLQRKRLSGISVFMYFRRPSIVFTEKPYG